MHKPVVISVKGGFHRAEPISPEAHPRLLLNEG